MVDSNLTLRRRNTGETFRICITRGCGVGIESSTFSEPFVDYLFDVDGDDIEISREAEFIRSQGMSEVNRMAGIIFAFIEDALCSTQRSKEGINVQLILDRVIKLSEALCNPSAGIQGVGAKNYERYIRIRSMINEI